MSLPPHFRPELKLRVKVKLSLEMSLPPHLRFESVTSRLILNRKDELRLKVKLSLEMSLPPHLRFESVTLASFKQKS